MGLPLLLLVLVFHPFLSPVVMANSCHSDRDKDHHPRVSCIGMSLNSVPTEIDPSTEVLVLSQNLFTSLSWAAYASFSGLHELDLSQNRIGALMGSGTVLSNLTVLHLTSNLLVEVGEGAFVSAPQLKELYLRKNHLRSLHPGSFSGLLILEVLDLSRNRLTSLPPDLLTQISSTALKTLDLEDNQITLMPPNWFDSKAELPYVFLSKNPWRCFCKVGYLQLYLDDQGHNVYVHTKPESANPLQDIEGNPDSVVCASPPSLINRAIIDLTEEEYCNPALLAEATASPVQVGDLDKPTMAVQHSTAAQHVTPLTVLASTLRGRLVTWTMRWMESWTIRHVRTESWLSWITYAWSASRESSYSEMTTPNWPMRKKVTESTTLPPYPTTRKPTTLPPYPTTRKPTTLPPYPTTRKPTTLPPYPTTRKPTTLPPYPTTRKPTTLPPYPTTRKPTTLPPYPYHQEAHNLTYPTTTTTASTTAPITTVPSTTVLTTTSASTSSITPSHASTLPPGMTIFAGSHGEPAGARIWCTWLFAGLLLLCLLSALSSLLVALGLVWAYLTLYRPLASNAAEATDTHTSVPLLDYHSKADADGVGGYGAALAPVDASGGVQATFRSVLFIAKGSEGEEVGEKRKEGDEQGGNEEEEKGHREGETDGEGAVTRTELGITDVGAGVAVVKRRKQEETEARGAESKEVFRKTLYRVFSREEEIEGWREVEEHWEEKRDGKEGGEKDRKKRISVIGGAGAERKTRYSLILREEKVEGDSWAQERGMEWLVGEWEMGGIGGGMNEAELASLFSGIEEEGPPPHT